ncbi:hypothetical protein PR048_016753 [Dryococelus australis]|uniref:Uncharacterized protein n=1 Tax=Dryococelus australis TaxID=614101 RepID=A0ABQ9H7Q0_9NEOP|nr:hypothetical protein PR048_016753 [Dryococelus australis]
MFESYPENHTQQIEVQTNHGKIYSDRQPVIKRSSTGLNSWPIIILAPHRSASVLLQTPISINEENIPGKNSCKNLGIIFDRCLS